MKGNLLRALMYMPFATEGFNIQGQYIHSNFSNQSTSLQQILYQDIIHYDTDKGKSVQLENLKDNLAKHKEYPDTHITFYFSEVKS